MEKQEIIRQIDSGEKKEFPNCDLSDMYLITYSFRGINLKGGNLSRAHFEDLILEDIDLSGAMLIDAKFIGPLCLDTTNLKGANLSGASFEDLTLNGDNLKDAVLVSTRFTRVLFVKISEEEIKRRGGLTFNCHFE